MYEMWKPVELCAAHFDNVMFEQSEEELSKLNMRQVWEAKMDVGKNLLTVFTQYEGAAEDNAILKVRI